MKSIKVHFTGIKGVGMTPLAIIAKEAGIQVTGSDVQGEFVTDESLKKAGIESFVGFDVKHVERVDVVITTGAHGGYENIEIAHAKRLGKKVLTQGMAVGEFMSGQLLGSAFVGISVTGTHGKTTTTAMIATVHNLNSLDSSYVIGTGSVSELGLPGHLGEGKYFIAEADEYATEPKQDKTPKFLWQHPKYAVITNIELDHPDMYEDLQAMREAYKLFVASLSKDGVLICCGDDENIQMILPASKARVVTYGFSPRNDFVITRVTVSQRQTFFRMSAKGVDLQEFHIQVVGEHNALNAAAAYVVGIETGLQSDQVKQALKKFRGTKRRFEWIGSLASGADVFDDYAHHPTEVRATLKACRREYPQKNIVCIFQPHTYSRTKKLFDDFLTSFSDADTVALMDIYASAREEKDLTVSSKILADALSRRHKHVLYLPTRNDVSEYLSRSEFRENTVILLMGAGDIYRVADSLIMKKKK